ncbi:hypothetical protein D9M71_594690 [compost metagenome]
MSKLHDSLYRPRGALAVIMLSIAWLFCSSYHFGLPSERPTSIRRLSSASELVESTPGRLRSCQSSSSTLRRMS